MQSRRKVLSLDLSPLNVVSVSTQSSFRDPVVAGVDIVIGVSRSIGFGWVMMDRLGRSMSISSILDDCSSVGDSTAGCPRTS